MRPLENIRLVALREIQVRVRSRAFRYSTMFIVALIVLGTTGARFVEDVFENFEPSYTLGIVDEDPAELESAVRETATTLDVDVDTETYASEGAAETALDEGDVDAVLFERERLRFGDTVRDQLTAVANQAVQSIRLPERLEELGINEQDLQGLFQAEPLETSVAGEGNDTEAASFAVASATAVLLFISIMTYGQWVLQGVVEEKASRVVEILLSTIRPYELLAGKVLGILALAGMQLAALLATGIAMVAFNPDIQLPAVALQGLIAAAVWFLLGLVLYGFIYGCAGALISRQEDAGNVTLPFVAVLTAGYMITVIGVVNQPDSLLARVLSIVPFTAPLAMPARVAFGGVGILEFALAVVLMVLTILFVVALGGRIYAGAVLRVGPRVALRDAWRLGR
ncbi:MAG: ABC transporter permease [Dehalococcoidia bacterium]|nr:ABC transporter permease [Dehalococcoidia bacterium]